MNWIKKALSKDNMFKKWDASHLFSSSSVNDYSITIYTRIPLSSSDNLVLTIVQEDDQYLRISDEGRCLEEFNYYYDEDVLSSYINKCRLSREENTLYGLFSSDEELYNIIERFFIFAIDIRQNHYFSFVEIEYIGEKARNLNLKRSQFIERGNFISESDDNELDLLIYRFMDKFHLECEQDANHLVFMHYKIERATLHFDTTLFGIEISAEYRDSDQILPVFNITNYNGESKVFMNEFSLFGLRTIYINTSPSFSLSYDDKDPLFKHTMIIYERSKEMDEIGLEFNPKEEVLFTVNHRYSEPNIKSLTSIDTEVKEIVTDSYLIKKIRGVAHLTAIANNETRNLHIEEVGLDSYEDIRYTTNQNVVVYAPYFKRGYKRASIKYYDANKNELNIEDLDVIERPTSLENCFDHQIMFTMPEEDVYIEITYLPSEDRVFIEFDLSAISSIMCKEEDGYEDVSVFGSKEQKEYNHVPFETISENVKFDFPEDTYLSFEIVLKERVNYFYMIIKFEDGKEDEIMCTSAGIDYEEDDNKVVRSVAYYFNSIPFHTSAKISFKY